MRGSQPVQADYSGSVPLAVPISERSRGPSFFDESACERPRRGDIRPALRTDENGCPGKTPAGVGGTGAAGARRGPLGSRTGLGKLGEVCMPTPCDPLLRHVLRDEALTRGLGDIEARMLVEWVADWTELLAEAARTEDDAWSCVRRLCRRGRAIGRFVQLWGDPAAAGPLANSPPPSGSAGRCPRPGSMPAT